MSHGRNFLFSFCQSGKTINEIGHTSTMQICKVGEPHKKMVFSKKDK